MTPIVRDRPLSPTLSAIEKQLAALWQVDEGHSPRVRACFYNLVAVARGEPSRDAIAIVDALGATHPARNIVVGIEGPAEEVGGAMASANGLDSAVGWDVNAVCRREPSGDVVCCERIDLRLGAEPAGRVVSLLGALLMPDLSTIVWLLTDPPANLPPSALHAMADRWLIDSRVLSPARAAELAAHAPGYLADLGWTAASTWRELLSRPFDDGAVRPLLGTMDEVELAYRAAPPGRASAGDAEVPAELRLIAGWLGSRLGLRWKDGHLRDAARAVRVRMVREQRGEQQPPAPAARLERVTMRGALGGGRAAVTVERDPSGDLFQWSVVREDGGVARGGLRAPQQDGPSLVARALDAMEPDRVLRDALVAAASFHPLTPESG